MSDPFLSEIRMFAGTYAPRGWAACNGGTLPIRQNTALFSLVGTYYGGDGSTSFGLPNLQGRAVLSFGQGAGLSSRNLGDTGGEATVTLQLGQMPGHVHSLMAGGSRGAMSTTNPSEVTYFTPITNQSDGVTYSANTANTVSMSGQAIQTTGGNGAHNNMQPYLGILFAICLEGIYPLRP